MARQIVQSDRAIWQSETAKTYRCPHCKRWIFSQYEGDDSPQVTCVNGGGEHLLEWGEQPAMKTPDEWADVLDAAERTSDGMILMDDTTALQMAFDLRKAREYFASLNDDE